MTRAFHQLPMVDLAASGEPSPIEFGACSELPIGPARDADEYLGGERVWSRRGLIAHDRDHPACAAFDVLRTRVAQRMYQRGWRTLGVTAPGTSPSKSLLAANLALALARRPDLPTLLADLDWRQPALARLFGTGSPVSLPTLVEREAVFETALLGLGAERPRLLTCNAPLADAAERLGSRATQGLIADVRDRYANGIAVFDLAPLLGGDDALSVLAAMDCVLLAVDAGRTRQRQLLEALRQLPADCLVGVALMHDAGRQRRWRGLRARSQA